MAGINNSFYNYSNSYNNNYSYLFGGSQNSNKTNKNGNYLGIDLAEYSNISRGAYSKLIKAYYQKFGNETSSLESSSDSKEVTVAKTNLKSNAGDLNKAASALTATGKNSLFNKIDIKDEEKGTTTKGYDTDKIFKAVNNLVESYNKVVKGSVESTDNAVLRQSVGMIKSTASNGKLLAEVGIKIGMDNTLSIDEDKFKNADMNVVKSLFNGTDSYGGSIERSADNMYLRVNDSFGNNSLYTSTGSYGSYSSGSLMDQMF